jgi:hypothetical protein
VILVDGEDFAATVDTESVMLLFPAAAADHGSWIMVGGGEVWQQQNIDRMGQIKDGRTDCGSGGVDRAG